MKYMYYALLAMVFAESLAKSWAQTHPAKPEVAQDDFAQVG